MEQVHRVVANTAEAPQPIGAYSQAVRARPGELVFVAGQVALDPAGNLVGQADVGAQTRQTFDNIGRILAGVGASFGNVVEFTTYLVGTDSIEPFIRARLELFPALFPESDYPPNTLLVVAGLVRPEFLVEVKAVAVLP